MGCLQSKQKSNKDKEKKSPQIAEGVSPGTVEEHYTVGKEIGRGAFSIVREAVHNTTGERAAIKYVEKKYVETEHITQLKREIDILKKVHHSNILQLKEVFETKEQVMLVLELVTGGELFYKITDVGSYSEKDARKIIIQILKGVQYLHNKEILHRDLKPENLLVSGTDEENPQKEQPFRVVIADFGLSGEGMQTRCGTPDYVAPEILSCNANYDKSVDMWAVGIITYILLCGYPPFYAKTPHELYDKILRAHYEFPSPEWDIVSSSAKDFIKRLMALDPKSRMTATQCFEHEWISLAEDSVMEKTLLVNQHIQEYNKHRENRASGGFSAVASINVEFDENEATKV